jgi:two-component system cell cycle response regulator
MSGEFMSIQEELSIISDASVIIISSLDIQRMLYSLVEELKKAADINWAAITRIEGNNIHYLAVWANNSSIHKVEDRQPVKGTAYERLVAEGTTIVQPDLVQESRFANDKRYIEQGARSIAYFPLQSGNRITGCIILASRKTDTYGPEFIGIIERLSPLIATQMENIYLYNEAVQMARVDELTGLHNRRALNEMISSEIKRCSRYGGVFSLIILDIDTLKPVNDTYGHLVGDEYIRQVGSIIQKAVRSTDRAFRHGGDEFSILLPETTADDATRVAERVRQQIASATSKTGTLITCSLGVANWPTNGPEVNDLINAADTALYQAKRHGRNQSNNTVTRLKDSHNKKEPSIATPPPTK